MLLQNVALGDPKLYQRTTCELSALHTTILCFLCSFSRLLLYHLLSLLRGEDRLTAVKKHPGMQHILPAVASRANAARLPIKRRAANAELVEASDGEDEDDRTSIIGKKSSGGSLSAPLGAAEAALSRTEQIAIRQSAVVAEIDDYD